MSAVVRLPARALPPPSPAQPARRTVLDLARECGRSDVLHQRIDGLAGDAPDYPALVAELLRLGCERAVQLAAVEARRPPTQTGRRVMPSAVPSVAPGLAVTSTASREGRASGVAAPRDAAGAGIAARLRQVALGYDWLLPNGAQLGMASLADLDHAIGAHSARARGHVALVRFYTAVRERVRAARVHTVADALGADDLRRLGHANGVQDDH
jgi:hypothetical protein